jgi:hypothetical protein
MPLPSYHPKDDVSNVATPTSCWRALAFPPVCDGNAHVRLSNTILHNVGTFGLAVESVDGAPDAINQGRELIRAGSGSGGIDPDMQ